MGFSARNPSQLLTDLKKREKQNNVLLNNVFSFCSLSYSQFSSCDTSLDVVQAKELIRSPLDLTLQTWSWSCSHARSRSGIKLRSEGALKGKEITQVAFRCPSAFFLLYFASFPFCPMD